MIKKISLAAAVSAALFSSAAMADSWTITQDVNPVTNRVTALQQGATNGSVQALNAMNSTGATFLGGSRQTVTFVDNTTNEFTQQSSGNATDGSTQAANFARADTLGSGTAFTQNQAGAADVELNQNADTTNSTQGVNVAEVDTAATNLQQNAITATNITATQNSTAGSNVQAINAAKAVTAATPTMTLVDQNVTVTTALTLDQRNTGTGNTQAANYLNNAGNAVGTLTQDTIGDSIVVQQDAGGSNNQAVNMAIGAAMTDVDQVITASGTAIGFTQGGTTAIGDNNLQAGNYVSSTAAVADVAQTLGDGTDDVVTFTQTNTANGVNEKQVGNLLDLTGGTASAVLIDQNLNAATVDMNQDVPSSNGAFQVGNMIDASDVAAVAATGAAGTQDVTVTALDMDQDDSAAAATTGHHQVANLIDASNASSTVGTTNAFVQTLSATTVTMLQDDVTTSLQAGNAVLTGGDGQVDQDAGFTSLTLTQTDTNASFQALNYAGAKF